MAGHDEDKDINILTGSYENFIPESGYEKIELDMGCGTGSFTAGLAARYPNRRVYGADVMIGRLRKVVKKIRQRKLTNMSTLRVEARMLIGIMLPDKSIDRIHLLCPDPWPKGRHRDHRLLCCDFTTQLHRVLKDDGIFHFSSDDITYRNAVAEVIAQSGLFEIDPTGLEDISDIRSDFENRWLEEGKTVLHTAWRKKPLPEVTIGH